jgi:L-fuculose-phosphate aldolase
VEVGQRLWTRGLVAGSDGNISIRLEDGRIFITPSGMPKGHLVADDIVAVDADGNRISGNLEPSSELAMHLHVYRQRPDINACVHAHPIYATAFAVSGVPIDADVLPETVLFVGDVPLIEYAPPGTDALPNALDGFLADHEAFLLKNHGLLTLGRNLEEAYSRHETVEHTARIIHRARLLGPLQRIPEDDYRRLVEMRRARRAKNQ